MRHEMHVPRPLPHEHAPFASTYIEATAREFERAGHNDILKLLGEQVRSYASLFGSVDASLATHRYAPGKWTLSESLVHVSDTERVFAYRLLRVARADSTPLPGFDQDAWAPESRATARPLNEALGEFMAVRSATLMLAGSLDDLALSRSGTAGGHVITAGALLWIIAGHAAHHLPIFAERYLGQSTSR